MTHEKNLENEVKQHFLEKIGLVELRKLKYSSRTYYITLEPDVVASYGLLPGDLVKIKLVEARKERVRAEETDPTSWNSEK